MLFRSVWLVALPVIPVALLALHMADHVHARMPQEAVLRAIRILLCVSGASLIARAAGVFPT